MRAFMQLFTSKSLRGQYFSLSFRMLAFLFTFLLWKWPFLLKGTRPLHLFVLILLFLENNTSELINISKFSQTPRHRNVDVTREINFPLLDFVLLHPTSYILGKNNWRPRSVEAIAKIECLVQTLLSWVLLMTTRNEPPSPPAACYMSTRMQVCSSFLINYLV